MPEPLLPEVVLGEHPAYSLPQDLGGSREWSCLATVSLRPPGYLQGRGEGRGRGRSGEELGEKGEGRRGDE